MNHTNYEFSSLHSHKSACMAACIYVVAETPNLQRRRLILTRRACAFSISCRRSLIFILDLSAHCPPLTVPVSRVECAAPQKFVQYSEACESDIVSTTAGGGKKKEHLMALKCSDTPGKHTWHTNTVAAGAFGGAQRVGLCEGDLFTVKHPSVSFLSLLSLLSLNLLLCLHVSHWWGWRGSCRFTTGPGRGHWCDTLRYAGSSSVHFFFLNQSP